MTPKRRADQKKSKSTRATKKTSKLEAIEKSSAKTKTKAAAVTRSKKSPTAKSVEKKDSPPSKPRKVKKAPSAPLRGSKARTRKQEAASTSGKKTSTEKTRSKPIVKQANIPKEKPVPEEAAEKTPPLEVPIPLGSYSFFDFAKNRLQQDQLPAAAQIDAFLQSRERCLIVQGFAGTGKTFLLVLLNDYLIRMHRQRRLMAPTGRAARMICDRTKHAAATIHSSIYSFSHMTRRKIGILYTLNFPLGRMLEENHEMVAIVDEGSLVSDYVSDPKFVDFGKGAGTGKLLTDLIAFLQLKNTAYKTKLIVFGDPCQLPPVNDKDSFALSPEYLNNKFRIAAKSIVLNTVVRQAADSGIVRAATDVRHFIENDVANYLMIKDDGVSVVESTREDIILKAVQSAEQYPSPFTVITYRNQDAFDYNKSIRLGLGRTDLSIGDRLIVCANNRLFGLLNGTFVKVVRLTEEIEELPQTKSGISFVFRDIDVEDEDADSAGIRNVRSIKILMNTFEDFKNPDISDEMKNALITACSERWKKLTDEEKQNSPGLKNDLYFNAVRAKYGYAITCHKAQGGEWQEAGIVFGKRDDVRSVDFRKWTYTALTRAKQVAYLVGAPEIHPLTRIKLPVKNGRIPVEQRTKARILAKYAMGSPISFLSQVLTNILTPHKISISKNDPLNQSVRLTFTESPVGPKFIPSSTVIDFYYKGKGNEAMFETAHAPAIKGTNAAMAKLILEELAQYLI